MCSWIYSRPLAESRAICTLVDHVSGSLPGKTHDKSSALYERQIVYPINTFENASHLSHEDADLSFHSQCIHIQETESPPRNILSTAPVSKEELE